MDTTIKAGSLVKYRVAVEPGDAEYRGRVIEINGDRGVMADECHGLDRQPIQPTRLFRLAEVEPA